jgi:hypothetical protein
LENEKLGHQEAAALDASVADLEQYDGFNSVFRTLR